MKLSRWLHKLLKAGSLTAILLLATSAWVMAQDDALEGKPELQIDTITDDIPSLAQLIRDEVSRSGGQLDTQRVQWVFALSTGHYAEDPQGAQAAREVALQILASLAASEDSVTVRAWEMTLWDHLPAEKQRVTLTDPSDIKPDSPKLAGLWPTTPIQDTRGGHDTEKAIVDLVGELGSSRDAIMILLTNDAPSVTSKDRVKLLGTNAPSYLQTLEEWRRVEGDKNGATRRVKYVVATSGRTAAAKLEMVLVLPREFLAATFTDGKTREELRNPPPPPPAPEPKPAPVVEEPKESNSNSLLIGAGVVIVVIILVAMGLSRNIPLKYIVEINGGNSITLDGSKKGKAFCQLVGRKGDDEDDVLIAGAPQDFKVLLIYASNGKSIEVDSGTSPLKLRTIGELEGTHHDVTSMALGPGETTYELHFDGTGRSLIVQVRVVRS